MLAGELEFGGIALLEAGVAGAAPFLTAHLGVALLHVSLIVFGPPGHVLFIVMEDAQEGN